MIYDIIIIGGGISSLYSAYKLLKNNNKLRILILEKNNYLGGRIKSFHKEINNHKYDFNEGAGRFNENHKLLINLIKEIGLEKNIIKIGASIEFIGSGNTYSRFIGKSPYIYIRKVIDFYKKSNGLDATSYLKQAPEDPLDPSCSIRTYTFYEYAAKVLNKYELKFITESLGYYKQIIVMNAFDAIKLFDKGMNIDLQFYALKFGMSTIIDKLKEKIIELGGKIKINKYVSNIDYDGETNLFNIYVNGNKINNINKIYKSKNCILAIPKPDLLKFNILNSCPNIKNMLNSIGFKSLCRIYSVFKKEDIWFKDIEKVTTNNKLRYIIPIDKENGSVMISYSDSKFADYWNSLDKKELIIQLKKNIYKTLHKKINDPIFTKVFYWKVGTGFWKKNRNSTIISKKLIQPYAGVFRKLHPASPLPGFVEILEARRDGSIQAFQVSAEILNHNRIIINFISFLFFRI